MAIFLIEKCLRLSYAESLAFNSKINTNLKKKKRKRKKAEASVDTAKPLVSFVKSNTWASFPPQKQHKFKLRTAYIFLAVSSPRLLMDI